MSEWITVRYSVVLASGELCKHNHKTLEAARKCAAKARLTKKPEEAI